MMIIGKYNLIVQLISFRTFAIGAMVRGEGEDTRIQGRGIIASSDLDFGIGQVIIKNVLIF